MRLLKERILRDGEVRQGNVLKVDKFLNHQCDIRLFNEIGQELRARFPQEITKILTIEASGIGIACIAGQYFDVPVVFAKKGRHSNQDEHLYRATVHSYTYNKDYEITVSQEFIGSQDRVLIIDDFLANGKAVEGLLDILCQAGAALVGVGIVIEKGFQDGGKKLRERGIDLQSLAIIDKMDEKQIVFRE